MSNWVTNTVVVVGLNKDICRFIRFVGDEEAPFQCAKIVPPPDEGVENVQRWCVDNWGIKKEVWDVEWQYGGSYAFYKFESPSCPPAWVYKRLVEEFGDLQISWAWDDIEGDCHGFLSPDFDGQLRYQYYAEDFPKCPFIEPVESEYPTASEEEDADAV